MQPAKPEAAGQSPAAAANSGQQAWPDDADAAAKELLSVVASLSAGRVRERDSLPTEDQPASPSPKRLKTDGVSLDADAAADTTTSPALALQQLREAVASDDEHLAAQPNARVEKWFFNRWYTGTVVGACELPKRGRVSVHFDDLPQPGLVDVDLATLRLVRSAVAAPGAVGGGGAGRSPVAKGPAAPVPAQALELKAWSEQQRLRDPIGIGLSHGFARTAAEGTRSRAHADSIHAADSEKSSESAQRD